MKSTSEQMLQQGIAAHNAGNQEAERLTVLSCSPSHAS